ncbi:MAG TPA: hypothetical protein VH482_25685 [Thermomicrobiales bacterium]|jgi:hypothetical protein
MSALSYRSSLKKIGVPAGAPQSYLAFASRPKSLRAAIRSMDHPASSDWSEPPNIYRDEDWTDEVQGIAWDGGHWIFSANANQTKPGHNDKAIYVFPNHSNLKDGNWSQMIAYKNIPHPNVGVTVHESDDHWGQITYDNGHVYVAHFWDTDDPHFPRNARVLVLKDKGGSLSYSHWIELDKPTSPKPPHKTDRAEFQAINPWDGMLYTCFGGGEISEFFIHEPNGKWTKRVLPLTPSVTAVQGACFSPNGHLYIATNETPSGDDEHQMIYYYSALNGHRLGQIRVLADEGLPDQELEGICYAPLVAPNGDKVWIHAILLENINLALDNIFIKQWAGARPDVI